MKMSDKARAKALAKIDEKRAAVLSGSVVLLNRKGLKSAAKSNSKFKPISKSKSKKSIKPIEVDAGVTTNTGTSKLSRSSSMLRRVPMKQSEKARERAALRLAEKVVVGFSNTWRSLKPRKAMTRARLPVGLSTGFPVAVRGDGDGIIVETRKVRKSLSRGSALLVRTKMRTESAEHRSARVLFHNVVFAVHGSSCHFCGGPATDAMHVIDRSRLSARQRYAFAELNGRPGCRSCHESQGAGVLSFSPLIVTAAAKALATLSKSGVSPEKRSAS